MAIDQIEAGLRVSDAYLASIDQLIRQQILNSWPDKIPGIDPIARGLDDLIVKAETALRAAEKQIKDQIEPLIKGAIPGALDVVGHLTATLDSHLTKLISEIATADDVLAVVTRTLKANSPHLADWVHKNVAGAFGSVALNVLKTMEGQEAGGINAVLDMVLALPNQPPWFKQLTTGFRHRGAEWQALALPAILVSVILAAVSAAEEPLRTGWTQLAFDQDPSKQLEVPDLITGHLRGRINDHDFKHGMREHGYAEEKSLQMLRNAQPLFDPDTATRLHLRGLLNRQRWETELVSRGYTTDRAEGFLEAATLLLPEDAIRSAFLRGMFNASEHDAALKQHGYTQDRAEKLRQLYFYIPGPQDLIHMGIRNVFVPEIVSRFQLDNDKPEAFVKAASQQGISDYWAGKYWQAHWIMPGREAFFEMFQRTVDEPLDPTADAIPLSDGTHVYNIIGKETLNLALRDVDTPPFYRDKLTEIAYQPLTRIDIRRLNQIGLLDHAGVQRAYLDRGYSPHRALQLADYTLALNARAKKDEVGTLTDGLRRQILRLYTANKLDGDAAKTALEEIGATNAEIAVYLAESDIVRESERATMMEAGIGKLYVAGILDEKDARIHLADANVPVDAMDTLFAKWNLEIQFKGGSQHIHAHRELTKTEVLEALIDGLIDKPTAANMLKDLGYETVSANAEISLALYKAAKATKTAQIDAVKSSYVNGVIEALEASNRLDALYVPADQRDAYLETWTLQRETRTERIPVATLRDMAKGGYLTETETLEHLRRHRYTDADAQKLLDFWKQQRPPRGLINVPST